VRTLLDGVNEVLKKASIISNTNLLTSLTNSGKQVFIDLAVQSWGESVDQIYSKSKIMMPMQGEEDQITLVENVRSYALPCDLVQIRWPLHEEDEGLYIHKYPGGYEELRNIQTQPGNYTGQPSFAAIDPIQGELYLNRVPLSGDAGSVYKFFYWRDLTLTRATDCLPFSDTVFRAMVPVVTEVWRFYKNNRFTNDIAKVNFGRAIRALNQEPQDTSWIKRKGGRIITNPLGQNPFENA